MLILKGHTPGKAIWFVYIFPNGQRLLSSGNDDRAYVWDLATGSHRFIRAGDRWHPYLPATPLAPEGRTAAYQTGEHIILFDLANGQELWQVEIGRTSALRVLRCALLFSPDGSLLASGGDFPRLIDVRKGQRLPLPGQLGQVDGIAFAPDGRTLALAHSARGDRKAYAHRIRLQPLSAGDATELEGHTARCSDLAFSPDGRYLAGACAQSLVVWDVASRSVVTRMKFDRLNFHQVAFTPDGRYLAAVRNDNTARFWDTTTWKQCAAFDWEIGPLISLAISPDGLRAAAGSKKGKIIVWDIDF